MTKFKLGDKVKFARMRVNTALTTDAMIMGNVYGSFFNKHETLTVSRITETPNQLNLYWFRETFLYFLEDELELAKINWKDRIMGG